MSASRWERLAEASRKLYAPENFEAACYRLLSEQVLYGADARSRVDYRLIESYERDIRDVLEPFGVALVVNRQMRYAAALPRHAKTTAAPLEETLVALVLRLIYDRAAREGNRTDANEVECDLVTLEEEYRQATGRTFPRETRLDAIMRTLKRWGIARTEDDADSVTAAAVGQPYTVLIRPGIVDVLGETALTRLAQWSEQAAAGAVSDAEGDADAGATDEKDAAP